jgi:K+ potassium transporter integral membrane domain
MNRKKRTPPPLLSAATLASGQLFFWASRLSGLYTVPDPTVDDADIRRYRDKSTLCIHWVGLAVPAADSRIFPNSTGPPAQDVVGAVSCIIWSLTLVPLLKYCFIVLRAGDDQGEGIISTAPTQLLGGTFVLYMLLSRYLNLDQRTARYEMQQSDTLLLTVSETIDSAADLSGRPVKGSWIRRSKAARMALLAWCLFGASCVIADGLLTPAVSVISAVTGICLSE